MDRHDFAHAGSDHRRCDRGVGRRGRHRLPSGPSRRQRTTCASVITDVEPPSSVASVVRPLRPHGLRAHTVPDRFVTPMLTSKSSTTRASTRGPLGRRGRWRRAPASTVGPPWVGLRSVASAGSPCFRRSSNVIDVDFVCDNDDCENFRSGLIGQADGAAGNSSVHPVRARATGSHRSDEARDPPRQIPGLVVGGPSRSESPVPHLVGICVIDAPGTAAHHLASGRATETRTDGRTRERERTPADRGCTAHRGGGPPRCHRLGGPRVLPGAGNAVGVVEHTINPGARGSGRSCLGSSGPRAGWNASGCLTHVPADPRPVGPVRHHRPGPAGRSARLEQAPGILGLRRPRPVAERGDVRVALAHRCRVATSRARPLRQRQQRPPVPVATARHAFLRGARAASAAPLLPSGSTERCRFHISGTIRVTGDRPAERPCRARAPAIRPAREVDVRVLLRGRRSGPSTIYAYVSEP